MVYNASHIDIISGHWRSLTNDIINGFDEQYVLVDLDSSNSNLYRSLVYYEIDSVTTLPIHVNQLESWYEWHL